MIHQLFSLLEVWSSNMQSMPRFFQKQMLLEILTEGNI